MIYSPAEFSAQGGTVNPPNQPSPVSLYSNYLNNVKMGTTNSATQNVIQKFSAGAQAAQANPSQHVFNPTNPQSQQHLDAITAGTKQGTLAHLDLGSAAGQVGTELKNDVVNPLSDAIQGKQSGGSAGFQTVGNLVNTAIVKPANQLLSPVSDAWKATTDKLNNVVDSITGQPQGTTSQSNNQASQQAAQAYSDWSTKHPEAAKDLESLGNITQAGMVVAGSNDLAEGAKAGADRMAPQVKNAASTIMSDVPPSRYADPNAPAKPESLSPKQQELQNNVTQTQQELADAQARTNQATQERQSAVQPAVEGASKVKTGIETGEKQMGEKFGKAATQIKNADPSLKLNLTQEDLTKLNALKEGRDFSLPDKLNQENAPSASIKGQDINISEMGAKQRAQLKTAQAETQGKVSQTLDSEEAQDLLKRLGKSTFKENTSGKLVVDQERIDLLNDLKGRAQSTFGHITDAEGNSVWDKAYQDYGKGIESSKSLQKSLNIKPNTPLNTISENVQSLSETPEGRAHLKNSLNAFAKNSGVDLSDPVEAIQNAADKEDALDEANKSLSEAQKEARKAQRASDIEKLNEQQKKSTFGGRNPYIKSVGQYFGKHAAWSLTGGSIITALGISALIKKAMSGK